MMNNRKKSKQIALLLALACMLLIACPALAAEGIELTSVPEIGASLQPGDAITFAFHVQDVSAAACWGAIQVTTAEGLEFKPETIHCSIASATDSVNSVVPGNDGFLLLPDGLAPGDSVSFEAVVAKDAKTPKCVLQTDALTLEAAYTVEIPQQAAPVQATPALSMEDGTAAPAPVSGWLIAGGVLLVAIIALAVIFRAKLKRWYHKIKKRLIKAKHQPAHAKSTQKDHAE